MVRTFDTHKVRIQRELTGRLWEFTPCQGEYAGRIYRVPTPGCWENYPDFGNYRGEGIYRTVFQGGGNLRFEFKGVSHTAAVFLDGREIARHYNAYTVFDAVVRGLPEGEHTLEIKADNRFSAESALHIPNDYMSYGGISRPVVMERIGDLYIRWVHVTPVLENGVWSAGVSLAVENTADRALTGTVSAVIGRDSGAGFLAESGPDASMESGSGTLLWKNVEFAPLETKELTGSLTFADVEEWSMEHPSLYRIHAVLTQEGKAVDDLADRFGFRVVSTEGKRIMLNGKPIRIKGFCRHEDHPQFGCALPYAAMAADLESIRHLGANSVRTAHYPNDEVFLDLCVARESL